MERIALSSLDLGIPSTAPEEAALASDQDPKPVPFSALTTKKARIAFIKEKLGTSRAWAARGMVRVFENQTQDEQRQDSTTHHNGIGFTAFDAELMSSFAKQFINRGGPQKLAARDPEFARVLSDRQWERVLKLMPKYAQQLHNLTNH